MEVSHRLETNNPELNMVTYSWNKRKPKFWYKSNASGRCQDCFGELKKTHKVDGKYRRMTCQICGYYEAKEFGNDSLVRLGFHDSAIHSPFIRERIETEISHKAGKYSKVMGTSQPYNQPLK